MRSILDTHFVKVGGIVMNKEYLLELKKCLDNKKKYTQYIGNEGPLYDQMTESEILELSDSKGAVENALEIMKEMIIELSHSDTSYSGVAVCPAFSVFVDNSFVNDAGEITSENAILDDYVGISFSTGYVYSGKRGEVFSLDNISDNQCIVYGKFSDFVVLLNECGFELKDISSFSDIKEKICRGFSPVGKIEVDFEKRKSYTKK